MSVFHPCTTMVPESHVSAFQVMAAEWVATRPAGRLAPNREDAGEQVSLTGLDDAVGYGRDPEMSQWTAADVTWFVGRRNPATVGTQALKHLVQHPDGHARGEDIAAAIKVEAASDAKAREIIAGAFGWIGRDCNERHVSLPFMFNDLTNEYWVTEQQAARLTGAGL